MTVDQLPKESSPPPPDRPPVDSELKRTLLHQGYRLLFRIFGPLAKPFMLRTRDFMLAPVRPVVGQVDLSLTLLTALRPVAAQVDQSLALLTALQHEVNGLQKDMGT